MRCHQSDILGHARTGRIQGVMAQWECPGGEIIVHAQAAGGGRGRAREAGCAHSAGHAGVAAVHRRAGGVGFLVVVVVSAHAVE